jgi:hypothetical protein
MKNAYKHRWLMLIAITTLLAACGGGSSRDDNSANTGTGSDTGTSVGSMMDSFTSVVNDLLGTSSDDKEPIAVSDQALASPENTEPAVIK